MKMILASCILRLLFYLRAAGTDLGQVVGPQDADRINDHREGDHQLDGGRNELASLQSHTANNHHRLRHTLATQGRQEGREDAVRERREKASHHTTQVERSRQYDNILRVQHSVCCLF